MQTRRDVVIRACSVPLAGRLLVRAAVKSTPSFTVIEESNCLARESARGFRSLLNCDAFANASYRSAHVVVAVAVRNIRRDRVRELHASVARGAFLIWESAAQFGEPNAGATERAALSHIFDIRTEPPEPSGHRDGTRAMYVRYHWPVATMVRTFGAITPVACDPGQSIAEYEGKSIALRKRIGLGGIVFLGSLLGPHLTAEDREARRLATGMLRSLI